MSVAPRSQELLDVVPLLYEAAVLPERWPAALAAVRRFVGGFGSLFALAYPASGRGEALAHEGVDVAALAVWEERHELSPWSQAAVSMAPGEVRIGHEVVPAEALRATAFYQQLLAPQGIEDSLALSVARSRLVVGTVSFYADRLFEPAQAGRLELLAPHLVRATALRNRVAWLSQRAAAFESGIERLPMGVVLVAADGAVLHANTRARALLDAGHPLHDAGGRLACADRAAGARLAAALREACEAAAVVASPVLVPRREGRPLQVLVSPARERVDPLADPAALVWIQDPDEAPVPSPAALEPLFGLSPAEARMAAALASGETVREHAAHTGVTEQTARWRLKQIQLKTGARTQADLVRLVLGSLPGIV